MEKVVKRANELIELLKESEEREMQLNSEYDKELGSCIEKLSEEYSPKLALERENQEEIHKEMHEAFNKIYRVSHFNINVIGHILAKLLSTTTREEYRYNLIEDPLVKNWNWAGCVPAAIVYPKERAQIVASDGNLNFAKNRNELVKMPDVFILVDYVTSDIKDISFYGLKDDALKYNYDDSVFPEIKEFIDFVLETHLEWDTEAEKRITKKELEEKLEEYLVLYRMKRLEETALRLNRNKKSL